MNILLIFCLLLSVVSIPQSIVTNEAIRYSKHVKKTAQVYSEGISNKNSFTYKYGVQQAYAETSNTADTSAGKSWDSPAYTKANTAQNCLYLNQEEKDFYKYWNQLRLNPQLFMQTYLKHLVDKPVNQRTSYQHSLLIHLQKQKSLDIILPDKTLFESAKCHAKHAGQAGIIGHDRNKYTASCPKIYQSECCSYGKLSALDHLINLLVDEGVPDLGHRNAMLGDFTYAGVSFQPHKTFTQNVVIDMRRNLPN